MARRLFRGIASALALDAEAIDDGETIVSELAANTLHVRCGEHRNGTCSIGRVSGHGPGGPGTRGRDACDMGPLGTPELWLYLRGSGERCELVCKVFDSDPGWAHGDAPGHGADQHGADQCGADQHVADQRGADQHGADQAAADAMSGRGLQVVRELSHGRWGYHLTRSRLGDWSIRGKAVWFTTPAPFAKPAMLPPWGQPTGREGGRRPMSAREAMARLEAELATRGFGDTMVRADEPAKDAAVLSVCGELTVWCRAGCAWLRAPGLNGRAWGYGDLVEVAEQAVEAHETLCADAILALAGGQV